MPNKEYIVGFKLGYGVGQAIGYLKALLSTHLLISFIVGLCIGWVSRMFLFK